MRIVHALLAAVLVLGGTAVAQQQDKEPLSDRDKADEATRALGAMRDALNALNRKVEQARAERDALRLNCINERKGEIAGLVRVVELSLEDLRAAAKERQSESVEFEFGKIQLARSKVEGLHTDADKCVGLLAWYDDDVKVTVVEDNPDSKNLDPLLPAPVESMTFRPPPASPIR
jgi:hypothetical protein